MDKKTIISIIAIITIIFGLTYFFSPSKIKNMDTQKAARTSTTSNNAAQKTNVVSGKTYKVYLLDFAFEPKDMTINKGDTITWINSDSVPHQIKGDALTSLSGPVINNGQSYSYTFNNIGTFAYHCNIHPSMQGTVTVK